MKIMHIVGARPNFMKVAPVIAALKQYPQVEQILVHTGQHYDANMSDIFFRQLGIPEPDINLEVGSGSHAQQTAQIMSKFEPVVLEQQPDWVLVYGDVNSTVAAALVCAKLERKIAHVEAGLRSNDRTMPEEINRLVTDQLSDLLFTPSSDGDENLLRMGIRPEQIHMVGNVMIDTLIRLLPQTDSATVLSDLGLQAKQYILTTLHRPSNVDSMETLGEILYTLLAISREMTVVFPIHPRTRARLAPLNLDLSSGNLCLVDPLGYIDFLTLQRHAAVVITDSGGIQEETTFLGVPCLTVRENTERPVTVTMGTNLLIGHDMARLQAEVSRILAGDIKPRQIPPLWDGEAAARIAKILVG